MNCAIKVFVSYLEFCELLIFVFRTTICRKNKMEICWTHSRKLEFRMVIFIFTSQETELYVLWVWMYKHANIGLRLNSPIKTAIITKPALAATQRDHLKYEGLLKNSIILLKLQDYCLKINVITTVLPVLLSEHLQGSSRLLKLAESNTSIVTFYGTFISNVPYCHNLTFKWRTTQPQFLETSVIFLLCAKQILNFKGCC